MLEMTVGAAILLVGVIIGASIASMKTKTGDDLYHSDQDLGLLKMILKGYGHLSEAQVTNVINDLTNYGISFRFGKKQEQTRLSEDK